MLCPKNCCCPLVLYKRAWYLFCIVFHPDVLVFRRERLTHHEYGKPLGSFLFAQSGMLAAKYKGHECVPPGAEAA